MFSNTDMNICYTHLCLVYIACLYNCIYYTFLVRDIVLNIEL